MSFIVEKDGAVLATFNRKEDLALNANQLSQEYVLEMGYIFVHVTANSRLEMDHAELVDYLDTLYKTRRENKEKTHKQITISEGVTGWHKKKIWVKR